MPSVSDSKLTPVDGVGARLRAAREERRMTLRELADTTKISVGALEALEENDTERLPGGIFTRAFVRAYAAEVGLDPESMTRDFVDRAPEFSASGSEQVLDRTGKHDLYRSQQRMAGAVLKLALVGAPLAALLLFVGMRDARTLETSPVAPSGGDPATLELTSAPAPTVRPRPVPVGPPVIDAPVAERPLSLVLQPTGDCWVSLTIDGDLVFSRVMRRGEQEPYEAENEIVLNIGDAGTFGFVLNTRNGRSLGGAGEVVTARITPGNYRSYIAP